MRQIGNLNILATLNLQLLRIYKLRKKQYYRVIKDNEIIRNVDVKQTAAVSAINEIALNLKK